MRKNKSFAAGKEEKLGLASTVAGGVDTAKEIPGWTSAIAQSGRQVSAPEGLGWTGETGAKVFGGLGAGFWCSRCSGKWSPGISGR